MHLPLPRWSRLKAGDARGAAATLPGHVVIGWFLAGAASVAVAVATSDELAATVFWRAQAVDVGRHVGFGLVSAGAVWLRRRLWPRRAWLGWLGFSAASIGLAALILPTDLDGLAGRLAERSGWPEALIAAALAVGVGGGVPLVAALTRPVPLGAGRARRVLAALRVLLCVALALGAVALNVNVSPGLNPSAHLYLSWLTAVIAAHAVPRVELAAPAPRASWGAAAALTAWAAWALLGAHPNSVLIQLARCSSAIQLAALFHADGGLDAAEAAVAARAGPFFAARDELPPIPPSPGPRPPAPIVIYLSIDSLRADVPRHPEHAKYVPNLVELLAQGASFSQARAPGSMTKYTISSVSTGKYFSQQYWSERSDDGGRWPHLDDSVHLATLLSGHGVFTAAFPSVRWFLNRLGLVEGFQHNQFEGDPMPGHKTWIGGRSLTRQLIERLEQEGARPCYYFIHYLDSHAPFHAGGRGGAKFTRYLRALRVVDGFIGEVRAAISRLGLAERVLLIVTSDHGEAFGEHRSSFHGGTLYDELVRVPLAVVGPGVAARQIDTPVSLIDLGPTVLDWFGAPTPAAFMGESLVPLLRGQEREFQRPIVAETGLKQAISFADGRKVIRDLRRQTLELYDLGRDPGELVNLSDDVDPDQEEHVLLLRGFFQTHTYRKNGYRVPYVK
jgi:hypothetical protein